ncbi:hypothetical protein P4T48_21665 [Bacillus paramycoides]|uniref:hypothetical protein n=1 Tax=Bacillus paramycoides TaxID=2026194 RepID=UPI002E1B2E91|nr:hypothetical protein [Bacillus paramycoides]
MELVYKISYFRMYDHYLPKLTQVLKCLNAEDLWKREGEANSIGGIVLHICEHVKRNTIRYSNPNVNFEKGIEEYFPMKSLSAEMLLEIVEEVFREWGNKYIKACKGRTEINLHSLFHLVEHTSYHLGQVVDRTKSLKRERFNFCQNGINEKDLRTKVENTGIFERESFIIE